MTAVTERLSSALADRYQIERRLGEGGMATVYLAEDLKHKRKVALKVLKPDLAAVLGAERFVQEITTTAQLQHPHILPLFDSGTADGFLFYVMPYIEGETLRNKLDRETQLSIDESVRIATEVADALDYAHRNGVIHRDIKPENILLHDGRPMVADFGIALAVSAAAGGRMTETGLSLGTPHYMSPEQATAEKDLSARSDIYSLASVLYEMLTGNPPHTGASAQQIIMKIVTEEAAPVTTVRKSVPPNVVAAVAKALEKLPADRFDSAASFATALRTSSFTTARAPGVSSAAPRRARWQMLAMLAALLVVSLVAAWGWFRSVPRERYRLGVAFAPDQRLQRVPTRRFAISPDGRRLAYVGPGVGGSARALWVRKLDEMEARPLPGTDLPRAVFFSPDGESLGFIDGEPGNLRIVSIGGGPIRTVTTGVNPWGGSWGPDGWLYFTMAAGRLSRVRVTGGAIDTIVAPDSAEFVVGVEYDWPEVLPNGKGLVFQIWRSSIGNTDIGVASLKTREVRVLTQGVYARYLPAGYLLYVTFDGALWARPFDQDRMEFTGDPVALESAIRLETFAGVAQFDVSHTGHLVYQSGGAGGDDQVVRVDRAGNVSAIDPDWRGGFQNVALSPNGSLLAVSAVSTDGAHIWVKELDTGPTRLLTFEGTGNNRPTWTADGREVIYFGDAQTLWRVRADGGAVPTRIETDVLTWEAQVSRDGQWLVLRAGGTGTGTRDIHAIRPGVDSTSRLIVGSPADEYAPALSPDGRWLAYVSNETGREEVYVRPFPDAARAKYSVTVQGGTEPRWSPHGRELFVRNARGEMVVYPVRPSADAFAVERAEVLFDASTFLSDNYHHSYDVAPDGHFIMISPAEVTGGDLVLVVNWIDELRERVGR
jgi:serine/threonine-protein kinase